MKAKILQILRQYLVFVTIDHNPLFKQSFLVLDCYFPDKRILLMYRK